MRYRKTRLISLKSYTTRKNAPLCIADMIQDAVNREDDTFIEVPKLSSTGIVDALKPSVGLWDLFKTAVYQFNP